MNYALKGKFHGQSKKSGILPFQEEQYGVQGRRGGCPPTLKVSVLTSVYFTMIVFKNIKVIAH